MAKKESDKSSGESVVNLVSVKESLQKLNENTSEPAKRSEAEVEDVILNWLHSKTCYSSYWEDAPSMGFDFKIVRSDDFEAGMIIKVKNKIATIVSHQTAGMMLQDYLHRLPKTMAAYKLKAEKCITLMRNFSGMPSHYNSLPKAVGFKSDPDVVMHRLDFDPEVCSYFELDEKAPIFAEMLSRMTNWEAMLMRIGSIFDPKADRKQSPWIYGPPDAGKSQIAWVLQQLAVKYAVLGAEDYTDRNFKANLLNKRVGIVQEASAKFIRSDVFKSLTGDGVHAINQKYQPIFNAELPILLFFFSNESPEIPHDDSLMERVIACKMQPVKNGSMIGEFELHQKLKEELPFIVGAALDAYRKVPQGGRIPCDRKDLKEAIDDYEAVYLDWIERNIEADESSMTTLLEANRLMEWGGFKASIEQAKIKRILTSRFKAQRKQITAVDRCGSECRIYVYCGVRMKTASFNTLEQMNFYNYHLSGQELSCTECTHTKCTHPKNPEKINDNK